MRVRWQSSEVSKQTPFEACIYATRLIGIEPTLVLHGGGNTSIKATWPDVTGGMVPALWVKGSGRDMGTIDASGFVPLALDRLRVLASLDRLNDIDMMRELTVARLDPAAPRPSVESLLHAVLPQTVVLHSHADAIISLTNTQNGHALVRAVLGDRVVIVPYVMPGFLLARRVRRTIKEGSTQDSIAVVLLGHGLVTAGGNAEEAYRLHLELITLVEEWLDSNAPSSSAGSTKLVAADATVLAELRKQASITAGRPLIMRRSDDESVVRFVGRADLAAIAVQGPLTPDHVIWTKRSPMIGRDVGAYAAEYRKNFEANRGRSTDSLTMLDPAPRVILDPELGMLTLGESAAAAQVAADIYLHTIPVIERTTDHLGGYHPLPPGDVFDVEYWALEQAKLARVGSGLEFGGQVAFVTGAASGIGRASAATLLERGAAVVGIDRSPDIETAFRGSAWLGLQGDVTDEPFQRMAVDATVEQFGGIDIAVLAAGIFEPAGSIGELSTGDWERLLAVNFLAVQVAMRLLHPFLGRSPVDGRVVIVGSKNVRAPGPGVGPYSASKAAVTQLARVAALEWAHHRIRVNVVHPDAVFDTGLWTAELIASRAARYGLTAEEYRRRNLLGHEVTAAAVGRLVAVMCGEAFASTTGAQIPIDGGNERVI